MTKSNRENPVADKRDAQRSKEVWWRIVEAVVAGFVILFLIVILMPAIQQPVSRGPSPCKKSLKQIGLALHNYHDKYSCFPPAIVLGPDGKRWHSWRALILPFLDEPELAKQYRFDEPWNGPNNSRLLPKCPKSLRCYKADELGLDPSHTSYLTVVGSETSWPGTESLRLSEIPDGHSNTVAVVEVREAGIAWLAPVDLSFADALATPSNFSGLRPSSVHEGGCHVLLFDGTVRFVNSEIAPDIWRALLTRDGGEEVRDF